MKFRLLLLFTIILCKSLPTSSAADGENSGNHKNQAPAQQAFPFGDPRNCKHINAKGFRMEVLPGTGWDNLQNLDMGQVLAVNYSQCMTTADDKYLLPDHTFVVPIKRSKVDMFSQLYEHWSDYKSATSWSVNLKASFFSTVSGSFSSDFQFNKEHQVNDRSFTTRVQVRHLLYTIKSQPDAPLSPSFINRLMEIAANMENNQTDLAWYHTQLLIREFGTHYTTSIDAGAAIMKEDHIKDNFLRDTSKTSFAIKAAASVNFFGKIGISAGMQTQSSKETMEQYIGNQTSSRIFTHGGPPFGANFTLNDWENCIANELVPIDRSGNPLYFAITPSTLPGLPEPTVRHVASIVEEAIALYYKVNTMPGCTNVESPNFHFQANVDDGTCKTMPNNFTFGGVYQKCYSVHNGAGNLCNQLEQKNPLTGDFTCPNLYKAVLLINPGGKRPRISKSYHKTQCHNSCHSCGFLWLSTCCHTECENLLHYSMAEYDSYWCAATGDVSQNSGVLFGGVYTTTMSNPATGSQKCPHRYYPMALGGHAFVCISDDYELGYQYSLRFAGFFSCSSGNPLAIPKKKNPGNGKSQTAFSKVEMFLASGNSKGDKAEFYGPHHCPNGYSQHLVTVDNQCEINYCIKAGSFDNKRLNPVKRPPFSPRPGVNSHTTEAVIVIGVNGKVWVKNSTSGDWELQDFTDENKKNKDNKVNTSGTLKQPLSPGVTAAISVIVTTLAGVLIAAGFIGYRRHRKMKIYRHNGLLDSYMDEDRKPLNAAGEE